jgi:hypothetical protein
MNARSAAEAPHPHFVSIPEPHLTEGVRAYREGEVPHPLQLVFLEAANEQAWVDEIRGLLSAGRSGEADERIAAQLAGFDGALARLCKATRAADVLIDGWDDLIPILEEWEGPPVTAITLGLTNPPDLVFEPGAAQEPELLIGLYSDEAFPFSRASKADLLAECGKESPAWVGAEEDVEFYCTIMGLAELNTALIHCKHRYFLRDGRDGVEGRAPGGYVEFVLASWLLGTRFLQASERAILEHGLPGGCRLIVGTVDVNADFVTILGRDQASTLHPPLPAAATEPAFATLVAKPWVPHDDPTADAPANGQRLRQRLKTADPLVEVEPRRGLLARLFRMFARS